ncbi:acyl-CoA dehydrogenase, C-terminal domain protein [Mycobacterium kansasii]|uniref:Acyl-CoA dehydrogenase, C-terminal domain protein n=1 Tax=Mycobacterium kansasii TaxID=1768 RepID=A0A1V3XAF2_MYCKA|nr:acyl-CoA dehydrogenase, C-terminal domain protein [Mycobacterium kansasii]
MRVRRLKDKLGTRSVASGEIEFVDAEAFLLSGEPQADSGPADGKGLGRMMELTNKLRLGTASFAVGNARRALVESLCYTRQRRAFGEALVDKPLIRRKLAEMIVDVEAALALIFDGTGAPNHRQPQAIRQRIAVPVTKLRVCRLGITAASDAVELHGGNGYIETWPVARILRDAQVNTIWEGSDNILCLDVRRGMEQSRAHEPLLARMRDAVSVSDDDETTRLVSRRIEDLDAAITAWTKLDREVAEARLFPLAQFMGDVYAGRCSPSRRRGSEKPAEPIARRSSPGYTRSAIWPIAARCAGLTPNPTKRCSASTNWLTVPSRIGCELADAHSACVSRRRIHCRRTIAAAPCTSRRRIAQFRRKLGDSASARH